MPTNTQTSSFKKEEREKRHTYILQNTEQRAAATKEKTRETPPEDRDKRRDVAKAPMQHTYIKKSIEKEKHRQRDAQKRREKTHTRYTHKEIDVCTYAQIDTLT